MSFIRYAIALFAAMIAFPAMAATLELEPLDIGLSPLASPFADPPEVPITTTPYEVVWDGSGPIYFLAYNALHLKFTDFHVRIEQLQSSLAITGPFFTPGSCTSCSFLGVYATNGTPGIAPGMRFGIRIHDLDPPVNGSYKIFISGSVPEPATWAMLVTGFGLIGAAMRRRQLAFA